MKKSDIAQGIFYFLFMGLWINGCIHSASKHKGDSFILSETPIAIYRGVEFFWHDDFAGVNWEERVKDDVGTTIDLMSSSTTASYNIDNVKQQINDFSQKISTYPKNRKIEIEKGVKQYLRFGKVLTTDLVNYVNTFDPNNPYTEYTLSDETKKLGDSLDNYFNIKGIKLAISSFDTLKVQIQKDAENISVYRQRINAHSYGDDEVYSNVYYKIFKEKL